MNQELVNLEELQIPEEELFSRFDHDSLESEKITAPRYSYWHSVFRVFFRKRINVVILALFVLVIIFAYVYPVFSNYEVLQTKYLLVEGSKHLNPAKAFSFHQAEIQENWTNAIHWLFGAGAAGQSTFDAVWYGSRISLSLAFICAAINMTVGVIIGAVWGFSKTVDIIMTEVYNIIGNVPYILFISVMVLIFSPSFWTMVFALTITGWLGIAYFIRTQIVIIRDREYNLASKCLGTSTFKIAIKNLLPFMVSVIVTLLASEIPSYISSEVFLSYIGMGMADDSLGKLIYESENAMITPGWEIEFWAPVAVASFIAVVLYVVGQNLGDASDPRTHM